MTAPSDAQGRIEPAADERIEACQNCRKPITCWCHRCHYCEDVTYE